MKLETYLLRSQFERGSRAIKIVHVLIWKSLILYIWEQEDGDILYYAKTIVN